MSSTRHSNNNDNSDNEPIPSPRLKKAILRATQGLGQAYRDDLFDNLEKHGIVLLGKTSYTLKELEAALGKAYDQDGALLLMQRVRNAIHE